MSANSYGKVPVTMNFAPLATDAVVAGVDVDAVVADLADDGVAAPAAQVDGLREVVAQAAEQGVQLRVVVIDHDPYLPEQLRDLATSVGKADGGTVVALSPHMVGTNSDTVSRFVLEGAESIPRTGDSSADVQAFVDHIAEPSLPWTAIASAITLAVLLLVVVGTALNVRMSRRVGLASGADGTTGASTGADPHAR